MTPEERDELIHRLRNTNPHLDPQAAALAMDDAADCIESGGASLRAVKRTAATIKEMISGTPHVVTSNWREFAAMGIIEDCQQLLAAGAEPGGPTDKTTITALLAILDGPRARALTEQKQ